MPAKFIQNSTWNRSENTSGASVSNTSLGTSGEKKMPLDEILELAIQILIAFVGAAGNVLMVIVISRLGKKKTTTDFYAQNLAIADLGILILTFPLTAIKENAHFNWTFGELACHYFSPFPEIFHGASVWFIAAISIVRYGKILRPGTPGENRKQSPITRATMFAAFIWVVTFLIFSLPLYFMIQYHELPDGGEWCGPVFASLSLVRVYVGFLTLLSYILPLIIISFAYLQISRAINQSSMFLKAKPWGQRNLARNQHSNFNIHKRSLHLKRNERIKKIITPVVLVFAVTMLPVNIFRLAIVSWPAISSQQYYENLMFAVSLFVILNSSANPIIYFIVSGVFRRETKKLFCSI